MIRSRIWRLFALLAVFSLVAVACGDSGDVDDVVAGDDVATTAPPDTAGGLSEDDVKDAFDSTTTTEEATETTEAAAEEEAAAVRTRFNSPSRPRMPAPTHAAPTMNPRGDHYQQMPASFGAFPSPAS